MDNKIRFAQGFMRGEDFMGLDTDGQLWRYDVEHFWWFPFKMPDKQWHEQQQLKLKRDIERFMAKKKIVDEAEAEAAEAEAATAS